MYVHRSNSAEALLESLVALVRQPVAAPTEPECIVVHGRGMERWLSNQLSRRLGVWANPSFPFPRSIIERAFEAVLGDDVPPPGAFQPGPLLWSIANRLPEHLDAPAFAVIRNYLEGDHDHRKLIQLSERIASTFDGYAVYRPEMVLEWERGADDGWQAELWRALAAAAPDSRHTAALAREFAQRIAQESGPIPGFPVRVSLFGISTLPPLYLRVLAALGERVDVHLFMLTPSRQFWGDLQSSRDVLRRRATEPARAQAVDDLLASADRNPLLASMGHVARDFQQLLESTVDYVETEDDLYRAAPEIGTMLATLQADVLELRYRHAGNQDAPPLVLAPHDDSITIHACHGPIRELEVLHDQLVALFESDPGLQARDVVVMMPDVEEYAPLIDAVFGGESHDRPAIPYRIADRSTRSSDEVVDAFARVLAILNGRMTAPEVLDVLSLDLVRARFDISADELTQIRAWVAEAGIRWAVDDDHRATVGQPPFRENTWRFGLDRLLLGYAMPGPEMFREVLPFDDVEGSSTEILGKLVDYCETLFGFRDRFRERLAVDTWHRELLRLLEAMVLDDEDNAPQHQALREAFADLADDAATAGFSDQVPLDSIRGLLEAAWQRGGSKRGFLSGGVTFCQLTPMRSIPFRVVCLVGMSDGAFPRSPQPLGFDLMAASPRVGDRAPRDDDRYLFLEALLSARDHLLITYVGQSIQNNRTLPPSVLVGELLDTLEESFYVEGAAEDGAVRERLVLRHPLQPFSPRYFRGAAEPRIFSYSAAHCEAARRLSLPRSPAPPFLQGPLPRDEEARVVTVDELARYFMRPAQVFLERRLGLYLRDEGDDLEDREPVWLEGLDKWSLGDRLLDRVLAGDSLETALPSVRGSGTIPLGAVGTITFSEQSRVATAIGALASSWKTGTRLDGLAIDRQLDDSRITGSLDQLWPSAQLVAQFSRIGDNKELGLWVRHLVLCWLAPAGYPTCSVLAGRAPKGSAPAAMRFEPVADPEHHLRVLLKLYWLGQEVPLPFFPDAARKYAATLEDPDSPDLDEAALARARGAFENDWGTPGEAHDAHVRQLFGDRDPLDPAYRPFEPPPGDYPSFADMARIVLCPMLEHRKEI